ncbi:MAG: secondary thiamine-phosphate synthase enzyme YjbQ [Methanomicrobiales archaeon]|nr:secondary thiamine-phosphate synthase enzyme YjbQ [Methanomicrobiales archaeon]
MFQQRFDLQTKCEGEMVNITPGVEKIVHESGVMSGLANIFVTGSTVAITTIEYEDGVLEDFRRALSVLAPDTIPYVHNVRWGDGNGRSHVKAACIGPSLTVPIANGALMCGTWQQVVLVELDVRSGRKRTVVVTVVE